METPVGMRHWKKSFGFRERIGLGVERDGIFLDGILIPSFLRLLLVFLGSVRAVGCGNCREGRKEEWGWAGCME